jgi:hypothetical protein
MDVPVPIHREIFHQTYAPYVGAGLRVCRALQLLDDGCSKARAFSFMTDSGKDSDSQLYPASHLCLIIQPGLVELRF